MPNFSLKTSLCPLFSIQWDSHFRTPPRAVTIDERGHWPLRKYLSDGGGVFSRCHLEYLAYFSLAHAAQRKARAILGSGAIRGNGGEHALFYWEKNIFSRI